MSFSIYSILHICPIAFSVAEWVGCSFIFSKVAIKIEPWRHWGEVMSCHQITSRSDINKRLHFLTQTNERKQNKRGIEFWPEEKSLFPLEKKDFSVLCQSSEEGKSWAPRHMHPHHIQQKSINTSYIYLERIVLKICMKWRSKKKEKFFTHSLSKRLYA